MKKKNLKIIILAVFIISAVALTRALNLDAYLEQDRLRGWIDGFGALGPLVYIFLYSIAPSLMFPGLALTVVGGILFGPYWGSLYVAIGATIGASLAFFISRYMGRDWVSGVLKGGKLAEIDTEVRSKGWKIVAFTRLIPLFPYNFLNYAFGLTNIRFSHYVIATFFFMIPGIVAYVVFSSSILDLFKGQVSKEFIIGVVLVAIVSAIPIVYKRYKKRHID
jgi:uncharacterized membrane protein YdjX (TVP38/TMEM64 family)